MDKDNDSCLTLEEFLAIGSKMNDIMKKQDDLEQKKKLNCLLFMSPIIQKHNDFSKVCSKRRIFHNKYYSEWYDRIMCQNSIFIYWGFN